MLNHFNTNIILIISANKHWCVETWKTYLKPQHPLKFSTSWSPVLMLDWWDRSKYTPPHPIYTLMILPGCQSGQPWLRWQMIHFFILWKDKTDRYVKKKIMSKWHFECEWGCPDSRLGYSGTYKRLLWTFRKQPFHFLASGYTRKINTTLSFWLCVP